MLAPPINPPIWSREVYSVVRRSAWGLTLPHATTMCCGGWHLPTISGSYDKLDYPYTLAAWVVTVAPLTKPNTASHPDDAPSPSAPSVKLRQQFLEVTQAAFDLGKGVRRV